jgi:hypothetical protein
MSKIFALVIEDDSHSCLRSDYNNVLRETLNKMSEKGILQTTINIKVKIKMIQSFDEKNKAVYNPQFSHKIKAIFSESSEAEGSFTPEDASMRWNKETNHFEVIQRQDNLFEHEEEEEVKPEPKQEQSSEPEPAPAASDEHKCPTCYNSTKTGKHGRGQICKSCVNNVDSKEPNRWNRWIMKEDVEKKSANEIDNKSTGNCKTCFYSKNGDKPDDIICDNCAKHGFKNYTEK